MLEWLAQKFITKDFSGLKLLFIFFFWLKKKKSKEFDSLEMGVWKKFLCSIVELSIQAQQLRKKRKFLFKSLKEVKFLWMKISSSSLHFWLLKACSWFWMIIISLHLKSQIFGRPLGALINCVTSSKRLECRKLT